MASKQYSENAIPQRPINIVEDCGLEKEINKTEAYGLLFMMSVDGWVYDEKKDGYYIILEKGKQFIEDGGYIKQDKKRKDERKYVLFTRVAAVIALALSILNTFGIKLLREPQPKVQNQSIILDYGLKRDSFLITDSLKQFDTIYLPQKK